jgi:hypothetical protein
MKRVLLFALIVAAATLTSAQAIAQDAKQTIVVNTPMGQIRLLKDEPFQVYVASEIATVKAQGGEVWPYGYDNGQITRLTPCDDVLVACKGLTQRFEGATVNQGDVVVLDFDHPVRPTS